MVGDRPEVASAKDPEHGRHFRVSFHLLFLPFQTGNHILPIFDSLVGHADEDMFGSREPLTHSESPDPSAEMYRIPLTHTPGESSNPNPTMQIQEPGRSQYSDESLTFETQDSLFIIQGPN